MPRPPRFFLADWLAQRIGRHAFPTNHIVLDSKRLAEAPHETRLILCFRAQAMIDRDFA